MKQKLLLFAVILILGIQSYAQTGIVINTTEADPAYSALLDVTSTTKGLLPPRMTYELIWALPACQSTLVTGPITTIGRGSANTNKTNAHNGGGITYSVGSAQAYTSDEDITTYICQVKVSWLNFSR